MPDPTDTDQKSDVRSERCGGTSAKTKNGHECLVHPPEFHGAEVSTELSEAGHVHCAELFDQDSSGLTVKLDLGAE